MKVNGFFVKGMSSLADNFDSIFVGAQDMLCVTLDTPHLPYSILMVIRRHGDEAVKWPDPFLVGHAAVIIEDANKITVLHIQALGTYSVLRVCLRRTMPL